MLSRPIEVDPAAFLANKGYALDLKLNGRRLLAEGTTGKLQFFNRHGERTNVAKDLATELATLVTIGGSLDGELMPDGRFWCFDMPACNALVTPRSPWSERRAALEALLDPHIWQPSFVRLLPTARTTARKRAMAKRIWRDGFEGYVLKNVHSLYEPGPHRSGAWTKVKNVRTVDCEVRSFGTDKHNLQLGVYHDGEPVEIGECSRYEGDAPRAKVGDVIEVAYLDAGSPETPRLCQPHAKSLRTDKRPKECLLDQLDGSWAKKSALV